MQKSMLDLLTAYSAKPVMRAGLDRRDFLRFASAAGLGVTAMTLGGRQALARQDAPPMATPQIGVQADGSTIWKVVVGGMELDAPIEYHAFFPGELTINAGDSIWFSEAMPMFPHRLVSRTGRRAAPLFIPDPEVDPATPVAGPPQASLQSGPDQRHGVLVGRRVGAGEYFGGCLCRSDQAVGLHLPDCRAHMSTSAFRMPG